VGGEPREVDGTPPPRRVNHELLRRLERLQNAVSKRVILEDMFDTPIKVVAGVDLAFLGEVAIAACVALNYETMEVLEVKTAKLPLKFPYIPGFLSFREGPAMVRAMEKLTVKPQIFLINAQGIAHPRLCGCASHVGVITDKATIGVAQSKLCGEYEKEPERPGEWTPLTYQGQVVGAVYKSKTGCKPIFISPGHKITLKTSIKIVKKCIKNHKLPEPLQKAHRQANKEKIRLMQKWKCQ